MHVCVCELQTHIGPSHTNRLNTIREVCVRCPLAMNFDLLQDLTGYKNYRDKGVRMAARSLIQLFRTLNPHMLHRKDRVGICMCMCMCVCTHLRVT